MNNTEIKIFKSDDGKTEIEVNIDNETVWLNQYQISELFLTDRTSIGRHISNIYRTKELDEIATSAKIAQVRTEGNREVTRQIGIYNLDVILSSGNKRIADNTLVALTLMIAVSKSDEKDTMIKVIVNLINRKN